MLGRQTVRLNLNLRRDRLRLRRLDFCVRGEVAAALLLHSS